MQWLWMLSLVLRYPVFLPSDEWSNLIVKLFVLFLLFSINCIRGTIGWGRCSIDNIFYLDIMPASNTTTHQIQWGKNIFYIFQNEYKENYMNVPIEKVPMNFDSCNLPLYKRTSLVVNSTLMNFMMLAS